MRAAGHLEIVLLVMDNIQVSSRDEAESKFKVETADYYCRLVFWPFFKKTQGKITQGIEKTQAIFQKNSSKEAEKLKIRHF